MTNILMLLIPKASVDYLFSDFTVRQSLEKMYAHGYNTIPVIDRKTGKYLRSVSYGDFLEYLLKNKLDFKDLEKLYLDNIKHSRDIKAVNSTTEISNLISTMLQQTYVPVVDDKGVFIGIVTRKTILSKYLKIDN